MSAAMLSSQGTRSSSLNGMPAAIFATFSLECSWSPSWNAQPSLSRRISATLVLPEPDTPITTSTRGFRMSLMLPRTG